MENIIFCAVEMATITVSFFKIILRLSIFKSWHYFKEFSISFFKGAGKSEIARVSSTFKKVGVDRYTRSRREIDI